MKLLSAALLPASPDWQTPCLPPRRGVADLLIEVLIGEVIMTDEKLSVLTSSPFQGYSHSISVGSSYFDVSPRTEKSVNNEQILLILH